MNDSVHPPASEVSTGQKIMASAASTESRIANATLDREAKVTAFLWVDRVPRAWNDTIAALLRTRALQEIHVVLSKGQDASEIRRLDPRVILHEDLELAEAARKVFSVAKELVLFVSSPSRPSPDAFDLAIDWMENDPRIGTVSFLSNSAGALSFPHRNTSTPVGVDGHDEVSLTAKLRERHRGNWCPTPIQVPDGSMVLVSHVMWDICGNVDDLGTRNLALTVAELALRGAKRGFNSYLDAYTFISLSWDGVGAFNSVLMNAEARHALHQRHSHFPTGYDVERFRPSSALAEALDASRAKALGLRVLIDGSALGPKEMGTQLLIMHLSKALAQRPEIQFVAVGVPDSRALPAYAAELKDIPKIQLVEAGNLDFPEAPHVDIVHRPYQPTAPIPWVRWRELAKRSIITVQDLIAYRNGTYFPHADAWVQYRDNFLRQISQVDAVVSISRDVVEVIHEERLPIDASRVFVVENGADARSKDQPSSIPDAILQRGWANSSFLFVLGATYAHKNRDLAIRVWSRLRERGFGHKMIMAGAAVPYGSSRIEECLELTSDLEEHFLSLPDIGAEERNWLLRNTDLAVYLTSAEGFGQVPFEAARMDVPTLFVSFGPLRELIDDPTLPTSYDVDGLVDRAEALLTDPVLAQDSISGVLKNIGTLNWAETARKTVDAYFSILDQPSRALTI